MTPEQGQLVRVRNRLFTVQDVAPHVTDEGQAITRVALECLDDDRMGEEFSVIWEREVNTRVLHADAFPTPSGRWDHPDMFDAFLTALRWTSSSVLSSAGLQAPFRGAIEIEPYQLEPAARAVMMPRVNLLIADDVGLGKTIEAGLVLQELIARARVRSCLIACPASLQRQWADEMLDKFNLRFDIVDRDAVLRLRREYGTHVNPWRSFPRLITSVDYLKRNQQIGQFLAPDEHGNAAQWDLLILDEAHNCAPSGRASYIQDSDRTRMLRQIAPHFRHRLFLTATPHNGFTESFTALLEQLDPLRFHRDAVVNPDQVQNVMIRRLKEELSASGETRRRFAKRLVRAITVPEVPEEQRAADLLDAYIASRVERAKTAREQLPVRFALNVLKKRFLSCPTAFHHSLENHLDHVTRPHQQTDHSSTGDPLLVKRLIQQSLLDTDDDVRRDQLEQDALRESTRFFGRLEGDEETWLDELWAWSDHACRQADAKLLALSEWVEAHLGPPSAPTTERLILFTEYRDTVEYLGTHLAEWLGADALLTLTGSTPLAEREEIKAAFQAPPGDHPVRVLIATDAAAEGLNLQNHCRFLIHYEIPWNPNRLEQRNGASTAMARPPRRSWSTTFSTPIALTRGSCRPSSTRSRPCATTWAASPTSSRRRSRSSCWVDAALRWAASAPAAPSTTTCDESRWTAPCCGAFATRSRPRAGSGASTARRSTAFSTRLCTWRDTPAWRPSTATSPDAAPCCDSRPRRGACGARSQ
jgi:superfamily II DNA or RNA helicase